MSARSRRDVLRWLAAAGGGLCAEGCARAWVAPALAHGTSIRNVRSDPERAVAQAHYVVRITLDGGFDSVMTVDAKDPRTAGDVDVPYRAEERLRGERRLFGPLIGGLLRHDRDMCIVHGVRHDTVAHDTGEGILRAGRKRFTGNTQPFGNVVGALLPGAAPIHHLHIQTGRPEPYSESLNRILVPENPGREFPARGQVEIDAGTITRLYGAPDEPLFPLPSWFEELQRTTREEAREVLGADTERFAAYEASLRQVGHASRLLASAERRTSLRSSALGAGLELAFHAIRRNHARFITVRSPHTWLDTHTDNVALQTSRTVPILNDIGDFIDRLKREPGSGGSLFEQTTVVIASELGRFPKLNIARGKDHWPETSWILMGRGVRPGVTVGATDTQFRGIAIGYRTGRIDAADRRPLDADALFATVLRIAGGDPIEHDYGQDSVVQCAMS